MCNTPLSLLNSDFCLSLKGQQVSVDMECGIPTDAFSPQNVFCLEWEKLPSYIAFSGRKPSGHVNIKHVYKTLLSKILLFCQI